MATPLPARPADVAAHLDWLRRGHAALWDWFRAGKAHGARRAGVSARFTEALSLANDAVALAERLDGHIALLLGEMPDRRVAPDTRGRVPPALDAATLADLRALALAARGPTIAAADWQAWEMVNTPATMLALLDRIAVADARGP